MSKKDKKIEIQLTDSQVKIGDNSFSGYQLTIGKKLVGQVAEIEDKFAVVKNETVSSFFKTLDAAVQDVIETYNLNN